LNTAYPHRGTLLGNPSITEVIRDAIRQRLLPPGMSLVQGILAEALGVSRIPVRDALHYLASEGLVTFTDEGAKVSMLTAEEIHELWTLRAVLEATMAEAILEKVQPAELAELSRLVDAMDTAEGDQWSDLNYEFHRQLYQVARLPHFNRVALRVLTQIEPYSRVAVNRLEGLPAAQGEHHEMIAAMRDRDKERLEEVLTRSSLRARKLLREYSTAQAGPELEETAKAAQEFAARVLNASEESHRGD
jgi:DNA-binding GntR family transcriptional regulator